MFRGCGGRWYRGPEDVSANSMILFRTSAGKARRGDGDVFTPVGNVVCMLMVVDES